MTNACHRLAIHPVPGRIRRHDGGTRGEGIHGRGDFVRQGSTGDTTSQARAFLAIGQKKEIEVRRAARRALGATAAKPGPAQRVIGKPAPEPGFQGGAMSPARATTALTGWSLHGLRLGDHAGRRREDGGRRFQWSWRHGNLFLGPASARGQSQNGDSDHCANPVHDAVPPQSVAPGRGAKKIQTSLCYRDHELKSDSAFCGANP